MEENLKQPQKKGTSKVLTIAFFNPEEKNQNGLITSLSDYYKKENTDKYFLEVHYDLVSKRTKDFDFLFIMGNEVFCENDFLEDYETVTTVSEVVKTLKNLQIPFVVLSGNKESQLKKAITIVDNLTEAQKIGLSSRDFVQIYEHGIPFEHIKKQLEIFKKGIAKTILVAPATLNNGIVKLSDDSLKEKAAYFDANKSNLKLEKFVPASGAASRMFKFLSVFLNEFDIEKETINAYINRKKDNELSVFIVGMDRFPFFKKVYKKLLEKIENFDDLERDYKNYYFIQFLLSPEYFDYANKPKGILPFHKYAENVATPIEEHLYECGYYATANGKSYLHFTVSEGHQTQFEHIINSVKTKVEEEAKTTITISYSYQNKSTDTIAVNPSNTPFRNEIGELVFRPGGHGALIENLNKLDSDIIFIKNIDNVIQNNNEIIALYKKALAGILVEMQHQVFSYLKEIESNSLQQEHFDEVILFLKEKLHANIAEGFEVLSFEDKINTIKKALDRPIRVCGMVKNEGEPGGGPFWIKNENNTISLQIVESSQVDLSNEEQVRIMADATHFNPVDLVCGLKNYKGEKFDLAQFIDHNSGFIVEKNTAGKTVKAYELPGLWNGAMANWITLFVEVPLITFNPVKTVNDLLKAPHQRRKIWKI